MITEPLQHNAPQVIIAGQTSQPATQALLNAAHAAWAPDKALLFIDPTDDESVAFWKQHNPEAWAMVEAHYKKAGAAAGDSGGAAVEAPATVDVRELGLEATGVAGSADAAAALGVTEAAGTAAAAAAAAAEGSAGEAKASELAAAGGAPGVVPTAFVCQNFTCLAPTSSAEKLLEQLSARPGKAAAGAVKLTPVQL
jgi:hypothetical protein